MTKSSESEMIEFTVSDRESGSRLDRVLARRMPDWSRSQLQRLVRTGQVSIDGRAARKSGQEVAAGERVAVVARREELKAEPEAVPLEIVYEDDDLAVVNKPAGMVVHTGEGVKSGTLVNALLHHFGRTLSTEGGEARPGIVHRLDKMTSGLILVAKNDAAHRALSEQFKAREVHKTYLALVHGRVQTDSGEIKAAVGRDAARRVRMKAGGIKPREAVTAYRVMERLAGFTLLEAQPRTGRTHQIRVHFASLGRPIVGDTLYGAPRILRLPQEVTIEPGRNFLHAAAIEFRHPRSGEAMAFRSPLPPELADLLERLRASNP